MKPTPDDLAAGIIAIDEKHIALEDSSSEVVHRLAELGLAQWSDGEWELTSAGQKLLPACMEGGELPELE